MYHLCLRLKNKYYGASNGATQRPSGGGVSGSGGDVRNSRSSSAVTLKHLPSSQQCESSVPILQPQTTQGSQTDLSHQKECSKPKSEEMGLINGDFLQGELVKAVKSHLQEQNKRRLSMVHGTTANSNINAINNRETAAQAKDDTSSDDDIEGTAFILSYIP